MEPRLPAERRQPRLLTWRGKSLAWFWSFVAERSAQRWRLQAVIGRLSACPIGDHKAAQKAPMPSARSLPSCPTKKSSRRARRSRSCNTEPLQHLGKRTAAMAHPQLLFGRCFRECETEWLVIEVRIVAKSIQSPGFLNDLPLHLTTKGSK